MIHAERPKNIDSAISSAIAYRSNGEWLWGQFLVAYFEDRRQGSSLDFVLLLYGEIDKKKHCKSFSTFLSKILSVRNDQLASAEDLSALSKEIWYHELDDTLSRKGLTRILDAISLFNEKKFNKFLIEMSRALQMATNDELYGIEFVDMERKAREFINKSGLESE